jgi:hypothetical protein
MMDRRKFTDVVREDIEREMWTDPGDRLEWLLKTLSIALDKIDELERIVKDE